MGVASNRSFQQRLQALFQKHMNGGKTTKVWHKKAEAPEDASNSLKDRYEGIIADAEKLIDLYEKGLGMGKAPASHRKKDSDAQAASAKNQQSPSNANKKRSSTNLKGEKSTASISMIDSPYT